MKYSYKWLQELSGTEKTPQELADFLTMRAFEVEEVEHIGLAFDRVVVGEVLELESHPDADKLRVAKVDVGTEVLQIVCGAPNVAVGQKVPVALVGAELPGGFVIQKREVRGVDSNGMICSQKELGVGEDHTGIWVLAADAPTGELLKNVVNDNDTLLDIKVLPDRAHDVLSHVGMAREIAALEGGELDYDYESLKLSSSHSSEVSAEIQAGEKSDCYIAALVKGVVVKESPTWLRNRLQKLGIKSMNNIVDITNYVMLELGQPLHAFDWDAIAKEEGRGKMIVRLAKPGEKLTLLDEKEYTLNEQDLVIADRKKPLALAGIMGGSASGVKAETRNLLLEAAHFDPVTIRKTRTRLGLRTDASDRFEKGLDPHLAEKAMVRALELIEHLAGGEEMQIDPVYSRALHPIELTLDPQKTESLLGIAITGELGIEALRRLGFDVHKHNGNLRVVVPTWRLDITSTEDLVEEIGKMIGYDAIPATAPLLPLRGVEVSSARLLERKLKDALVAGGFTEVYNYSFYSEGDAEAARFETSGHVRLANPMTTEQALMRVSLAPGLLRNVRENLKHFKVLSLFEWGRVYAPAEKGGVEEKKKVAGAVVLEGETKEHTENFFALKGVLSRTLDGLGFAPEYDTATDPGSFWHPTRTADVLLTDKNRSVFTGRIGEIHPFVLERFKIKRRVAYFELDFEILLAELPRIKTFTPLRRYPEVLRDVSLYVPNAVRVKDITDIIRSTGGELVLSSELFDQYFDAVKNMKSLAFRIHFGAEGRTLSGEETDALLERISSSLEQNLGVERRV
jgi:phenylalanyl-tRNA synthetase beta chain